MEILEIPDHLKRQRDAIERILTRFGIRAVDLAGLMGKSRSRVSRWKNPREPRKMGKPSRLKLAAVLGAHCSSPEELKQLVQEVGWTFDAEEQREAELHLRRDYLARPRTEGFIGREQDFRELREGLLKGGVKTLILVVEGQVGVGKTWLASRILDDRSVRERFSDGVYWVSMESEPNQQEGLDTEDQHAFESLLEQVFRGRPRPARPWTRDDIRKELAKKRVLLVLDGVAGPIDLDQWMVVDPIAGRLLVTTIRTDLESSDWKGRVCHPKLAEMPTPQSRELLLRGVAQDISEADLERMLRALAGLPLFLDNANRTAVLDKGFGILLEDMREGVLSALDSLDAVTKRDNPSLAFRSSYRRLHPQAARLFRCLSVFPQPFHLSEVVDISGLTDKEAVEAFRSLARAGLIDSRGGGIYGMHHLWHEYSGLIGRQEDTGTVRAWKERFAEYYLGKAETACDHFDRGEFDEAYSRWQSYVIQIERACLHAHELGRGNWVLRYFTNASQYLTMVGSEIVLDTWWKWVQNLVQDEWKLARASLRMADCCRVLGRHEQSISLARRVRQAYASVLDDAENRTLWVHSARLELLGLFSLRRVPEAEQLWDEIRSVSPDVGPIDPPDMMLSTIRRVPLPEGFSDKDCTEPSTE